MNTYSVLDPNYKLLDNYICIPYTKWNFLPNNLQVYIKRYGLTTFNQSERKLPPETNLQPDEIAIRVRDLLKFECSSQDEYAAIFRLLAFDSNSSSRFAVPLKR